MNLPSATNSLKIANKGLIVFLSRQCICLVEYFRVLKYFSAFEGLVRSHHELVLKLLLSFKGNKVE